MGIVVTFEGGPIAMPIIPDVYPLRPKRSPREPSFLYAFAHSGRVKLGRTIDIATRLKDLQRGAGGLGELLALVSEDLVSEAQAHRRWAHLRVTGEWFTLTDELGEWLRSLGRADAAT